jgi:hypothetical protein
MAVRQRDPSQAVALRRFGYEGTLALLGSGALEIRCECTQFIEGQAFDSTLPSFDVQFHVIEAHDRNQYLIDNLSEVNRAPGLRSGQLMTLRTAVMKAIRQPANTSYFRLQIQNRRRLPRAARREDYLQTE